MTEMKWLYFGEMSALEWGESKSKTKGKDKKKQKGAWQVAVELNWHLLVRDLIKEHLRLH